MRRTSIVACSVFVVMCMISVSVASQEALGEEVYVGWGGPELIETSFLGPAEEPQVAMDGSGNAIAVWSQSDGTRYDIWANRYVAGIGWGEAELIGTDDEGDALNPQVAVHGSGNATATWNQFDGTFYSAWANQYVVGTGWGTPELIETDDDSTSGAPHVVIDRSGNVTVVWSRGYSLLDSHVDVMMNRYVDGSWGTPRELDNSDDPVSALDLAVDNKGNVTIVWAQYSPVWRVFYARYYPSTDSSYPYLLSDLNADHSVNPCVAFDGSGNGIAVWQGDDYSRDNITSRRYVLGSGWGLLEPLETFDVDATNPQIAMDDSGNATVVWRQNGVLPNGLYHIFSNRYVVGVGWGAAEPVATTTNQAYDPHVAVDGSGNAFAVWNDYDGVVRSIFAARYAAGEGWGEAELLETANAGGVLYPQVAADGSGNAVAVWQQDDGTRDNVYSNRYAVPDLTPPALSLDSPSDGLTTGTPAVTVSGETEPGAALDINGLSVVVGLGGSFSCEVGLVDGANTITATATDASGNRASVSVSVTYVDPSIALEDQLSGLEEELAALLDELESVTEELNGTTDELAALEDELGSVRDELDLARGDLDGARSQITLLMAVLAVLAVLAFVMVVMYLGLRKKMAGGKNSGSGESPPGPPDG